MAKTIKMYDGVTVTVDGQSQTLEFISELWEVLNITPKYFNPADLEEAKTNITTNLICFGRMDLSDAYRGHTVLLSLVPAKKGE